MWFGDEKDNMKREDQGNNVTRQKIFDDAAEMFGEMRHSTEEEDQIFRETILRHSSVVPDVNIFELDGEGLDSNGFHIDWSLFEKEDSNLQQM